MKILLLGKDGQIGWELQRTLVTLGFVTALGRSDLDLLDHVGIRNTVRRLHPDCIVNAAAYTAVDHAEQEPELAMAVNADAPRILAEEASRCKAILVHYSTDYIFDGAKRQPYLEDDDVNPLNIYGWSKWQGEKAVRDTGVAYLVFRTSWIYGLRGKNFLLTIMDLARKGNELTVVNDQVGTPTWSRLVAEATAQCLAGKKDCQDHLRQTYHLACAGETTWYDFARAILDGWHKSEGVFLRVTPVKSNEYNFSAKRPGYSVLSTEKFRNATGLALPPWQEAMLLALQS